MDVQTLLLPYIKKRQDGCKSSFFRCQKYLNGLTIAHPYLPRRLKILFNVQKYSACPASLFTSNIISKRGRCMRNLLFAEGTNKYSSWIFKLDSYFRINNFHNAIPPIFELYAIKLHADCPIRRELGTLLTIAYHLRSSSYIDIWTNKIAISGFIVVSSFVYSV